MNKLLALAASLLCGCGVSTLEIEDPAYLDHDPAEATAGLTASQAGGCSGSIVAGIDAQLVEELNCISPNLMQSFAGADTRYSPSVRPFLHPTAVASLHRATGAAHDFMTINSAYRTVAEQYVLYHWWQQGRCGIQVAATPGASNHQSGRALDVQAYTFWRPYLQGQGWTWHGTSDLVHYDFLSSAPALAGRSVLAFQRLWNKNNASKLVEDGIWGPASNGAMANTPVTGFANHGCAPVVPPTGTLKGIVYIGADTTKVIAGATVKVAGQTLTTDAAGLYTVTLPTGMYAVTASAAGYADGSLTRQVQGGQTLWGSIGLTPVGMPDTLPPDLMVASPVDRGASDVALIVVTGTTSDASGGAVSLALAHNGLAKVPVVTMNGMFEHQVKLEPGQNTVELTATDPAGNVKVVSVEVRFRTGLEGEVMTTDLNAKPIEGVAIKLLDPSGAVIASTQSGTDGRYAFELEAVPLKVSLIAESSGYEPLATELDIGAEARAIFDFTLSADPEHRGEPMMMDPRLTDERGRVVVGTCTAAPGLPLALLGLVLLRRRARASVRVQE